ncbi:MAG: hypothetical protein QNL14_07375 [Deltaproteobacteria bacterium]|nr:hypothetical protein [Deltaproteobacteria bacterium]
MGLFPGCGGYEQEIIDFLLHNGVNSFQTARALAILRAITGNLGVPGGDLLPSYPLAGPAAPDITLRDRIKPRVWDNRFIRHSSLQA